MKINKRLVASRVGCRSDSQPTHGELMRLAESWMTDSMSSQSMGCVLEKLHGRPGNYGSPKSLKTVIDG